MNTTLKIGTALGIMGLLSGCGLGVGTITQAITHGGQSLPKLSVPVTHPLSYINAYNEQAVDAFMESKKVSAQNPGIPASGPNAGLETPAMMNSPGMLKMWPGPLYPDTLAAAGIAGNFPSYGTVQGVNSYANATWSSVEKYFPGMAESIYKQGLYTAAEYYINLLGQNPMAEVMQTPGPWYKDDSGDKPAIQAVAGGYIGGNGSSRFSAVYNAWARVPVAGMSSSFVPVNDSNLYLDGYPKALRSELTAPWGFELDNFVQVLTVVGQLSGNHINYTEYNRVGKNTQLFYVMDHQGRGKWVVYYGTFGSTSTKSLGESQ